MFFFCGFLGVALLFFTFFTLFLFLREKKRIVFFVLFADDLFFVVAVEFFLSLCGGFRFCEHYTTYGFLSTDHQPFLSMSLSTFVV